MTNYYGPTSDHGYTISSPDESNSRAKVAVWLAPKEFDQTSFVLSEQANKHSYALANITDV